MTYADNDKMKERREGILRTQKVFRGRGSLGKLPEMTEKLGISRPLIVGSSKLTPGVKRLPGMADLPVFNGYHPNPDLSDALNGAEIFRKEKCDGLISLGGGSAMDTAKAVQAFLIAEPEEVRNNRLPGDGAPPHIAIPGTAGSGAEATANAVVYVEGNKLSLGSEALLPSGVILDANMLDTLPVYHKKSSALDALAQGIESYWSISATDDSRVHAYLAILGVLDNLKAYLDGDGHAAEEMLDASYQSGKAIRITRTTAAHAMSYQITKTMGLAHGHAVMLTLPVLWDLMLEEGGEKNRETLEDLSEKMRLGNPLMGSRLLRGILYDLDMEIPRMPEKEMIMHLADSVNVERLGNHPMKMNREDLEKVYTRAFMPVEDNVRQACLDIWRYYGGRDNG